MSDIDLDQLLDELGVSLDDTLETTRSAGNASGAPRPTGGAETPASPMASPPPEAPSSAPLTPPDEDDDGGNTDDATDDAAPTMAGPATPGVAPEPVQAPAIASTVSSLRLIYDPKTDPERIERPSFGTLLAERGVIEKKVLTAARTVLKQSPGLRLLDVLRDQGADEVAMLTLLAESMGLRFRRVAVDVVDEGEQAEEAAPDAVRPSGTLIQRMGSEYCKESSILPLAIDGERIIFATSRPDDAYTIEDARRRLGARAIGIVVAPSMDILKALEPYEEEDEVHDDVDSILGDIDEDDVLVEQAADDEENLEEEAAEGPVIRLVNYIIQTALKEGASDIHVEPAETTLKIRFRIDGILFEMMQPPVKMAPAITSRLKIMANLDISERRVPQDGRIRCTVMGRKMDLRMSTLPTAWGEKTVLRILDQRSINVSLDDLGFGEDALHIWRNQVEQPHGVVLVTGPTGSGKTTTLYASLRAMDKTTRNISTVEDPIEYQLEGITQTGTQEKIGMTFAKALKALLRQDPDIIMLGEIRDIETASTAIQAALTGHLVLSTLHTNDAPSSITRLVNIGIEPFLLGAACNATLAQRLVRRNCNHCKAPAELTEEQREFFEMQGFPVDQVVQGSGCEKCRNLGYSGRVGLYELLVIDDHLRDIIARNPNVTEFRRLCCERGMVTLREDGYKKVCLGQTTIQEVLRVTEASI